MLEVLPHHIRSVLLDYPFIVKYLNGKGNKHSFLASLKIYQREIIERGVYPDYVNLLITSDDGSQFHRKAAYSRFVRFARKIGLDIATPEDKVRWIKSVNANKLLDIMSIGAGLLRGLGPFLRWDKLLQLNKAYKQDTSKITTIDIGGHLVSIDMEPPKNSYIQFTAFFNRMRKGISVRNMNKWAVKLYFAVICAHIFPDGNGRIARNAYFTLRSNGLLDELKVTTRSSAIKDTCKYVTSKAILYLAAKEGIQAENIFGHESVNYFADAEQTEVKGNVLVLKYLACKRILQKRGQWNINMKRIVYGNWPKDMLRDFKREYQKIRVEWFWACIKVADNYHELLQDWLDKAIIE